MGTRPTWLIAKLVCGVAFAEATGNCVFRQASLKGMGEDKDAKNVNLETEKPTDEVVANTYKVPAPNKKNKRTAPLKDNGRKRLLNPKDETQVLKIVGPDLTFTNLSKIYWPENNITKRDMFNFI